VNKLCLHTAAVNKARSSRFARQPQMMQPEHRREVAPAPLLASTGALLVLGGAHALRGGVPLAHVGASLRLAVILVAGEVVDLRLEVGPHDDVAGAMALRLR